MATQIPTTTYSGAINEITLGTDGDAVTVGGASAYSFHNFEGELPRKPLIAFEVPDSEPENWPPALKAQYEDVWGDPAAWAKKCVEQFGADLIHIDFGGTDPNGADKDVAHAVAVAKAVAAAVKVPIVAWGTANVEKDTEVLRGVSEALRGRRAGIGPIQDTNYKQIGASVISDGHVAINSTPIDINLAKQLNILTENLGVPVDAVLIDPTTGGLGYGLEYSYTVMERCRQAALTQQDAKLQYPLYCNLGKEVWKVKEAALTTEQAPTMGDPEQRGIVMEAVTATSLLLAGADVLVMRHPEAVKLIREMIESLPAK
jgi:acetyl-CoA decarbonylase/synthase complex subunit delta